MASADRLIELFHEAQARPAGPERQRFLAEACADDSDLKEQVISLLQAHEGAGDFLKNTILSPTAVVTEKPGDRIGRYKLLQQLGEGGCGVVYMAEQAEPVRRKVALKVIKLGMDTKQVVARFEAERQALALMDHPNIAKVFDAGATEAGRPFFVMELVRGIKITDYCDQNQLSTAERLDLFIQVCQAIQHAHQKGIIHRDIKPSNILVTQHDTVAVPKVIDFGIAKATSDQRLTDKTLFTAFEQFMGTPAYMSPEQAQLSGLDIDTRTDIYSLGVLLYELLAGSTPFDAQELLASGLDAMRRTIREKEPVRPSTKLSQMLVADDVKRLQSPSSAAPRSEEEVRASSHRLLRIKEDITRLRGDIDSIVMKCLEKDRARRYETANGLAADLKRHLNNEPVVARPPSRTYLFRKLVRRNQLAFAATAAVAGVLVLGALVSTWQAVRATLAQRAADTARQHETQLRVRAETAEDDAEEKLWSAYLAEARARRRTIEPGHRLESLAALGKAVALRPGTNSLALRNEAVAALALADLRFVKTVPVTVPYQPWLPFDSKIERYAELDPDGTLHLRRTSDDAELLSLPGPVLAPQAVCRFSPDDRCLLVYDDAGQVVFWDLARQQVVFHQSEQPPALSFDFTPDSRLLAVGQRGGEILMRSTATGETNRVFTAGLDPYGLSFSPDGRQLAVWHEATNRVELLDAHSGLLLRALAAPGEAARANAVTWSSNGGRLAVGAEDRKIYVWDAATGQPLLALEGHASVVRGVDFLGSEDRLLSFAWDGTLRLWDLRTGRESLRAPGLSGFFQFSSAKLRLAVRHESQNPDLYELVPADVVRELYGTKDSQRRGTWCVAFGPDERWLVSGSEDGLRWWDAASGRELVHVPGTLTRRVFLDSTGANLVTCSRTEILQWPIGYGAEGETVIGPSRALAPSQAPKDFVAASLTPQADLFATVEGGRIRGFRDGTNSVRLTHSENVYYLATSRDGKWLSCSYRREANAKLFSLTEGKFVRTVPTSRPASVAFTPDGRWLVTGSFEEYRLWDVETGQPGVSIPREQNPGLVGRMAFTDDGKLMAIARSQWVVSLIDPTNGRELARLEHPHPHLVSWLAFSPSGTQLAVATEVHVIQLWDLRRLRQELAALKLDWDQPRFAPANTTSREAPLRLQVLGASVEAGR